MIVKASINFEYNTDDWDDMLMGEFSTDPAKFEEEVRQYALDCAIDDIYSYVKYNEVSDAIDIEVIK